MNDIQTLRLLFATKSAIEFAVLIGSRARGTAHQHSDWDIAVQWAASVDWWATLADTETLRREIAKALAVAPEKIDLIELPRANLALRAVVAEEGVVLHGAETLAWARFLTRTWRELEDFYWERRHAA